MAGERGKHRHPQIRRGADQTRHRHRLQHAALVLQSDDPYNFRHRAEEKFTFLNPIIVYFGYEGITSARETVPERLYI